MDRQELLILAKPLLQDRIYTFDEVKHWLQDIINERIDDYEPSLLINKLTKQETVQLLRDTLLFLNKNHQFLDFEDFVRGQLTKKYMTKLAVVAWPLRVAISGKTVSLPLFQSVILIGEPVVKQRIETAINKLEAYSGTQSKEENDALSN